MARKKRSWAKGVLTVSYHYEATTPFEGTRQPGRFLSRVWWDNGEEEDLLSELVQHDAYLATHPLSDARAKLVEQLLYCLGPNLK